MKKQKLLLSLAGIAIIIAIVIICCSPGKNEKKPNPIIEISYETMIKKFEASETFILFIGANDCTHCLELKPVLIDALNDIKKTVYYIDTAKLSKEQINTVKEKYVAYPGTPTVSFIHNGKENQMRRFVGSGYSKDKIISLLEKGSM